ncbi:MAG: twin-arginine translocation signal domain-containing protein, partial [Candidatus Wenzhouxiangella sp. M2_3B_020]
MKLIRKQSKSSTDSAAHESAFDRRTFLKRSGLTASGAAVAASIPLGMMRRRAEAQTDSAPAQRNVEVKRTVCSHCSVGCGSIAHVENG